MQVSGSKGREHVSVEGDNGGWDGTAIGWWFETEPLAIDFNDSEQVAEAGAARAAARSAQQLATCCVPQSVNFCTSSCYGNRQNKVSVAARARV
jgi:hypothetical protein